MGDDRIDTVILDIDMGYLVTLVPAVSSSVRAASRSFCSAASAAFRPHSRTTCSSRAAPRDASSLDQGLHSRLLP